MTHNKDTAAELAALKALPKPTPTEKAQIKALERQLKKESQKGPAAGDQTANVFAITATTKISPLPIRFTATERAGLTTLRDDLRSQAAEQIVTELGSLNEINDTKLVRAAVLLLQERTPDEIIAAIKEVKLNMLR